MKAISFGIYRTMHMFVEPHCRAYDDALRKHVILNGDYVINEKSASQSGDSFITIG